MSKISRVGNILFYIFITICTLIIFTHFKGVDNTEQPFGLWYVYSGSMEPTIKINDGYILMKTKEYMVDDIVTFKPKTLKDKYVTHRIIEIIGDDKFITRGDNNQSTDQEFGEPFITKEQIIGKAFMISGKPLTIPFLGLASQKFNEIVKGLNIFILISAGIGIYLVVYIIDSIINRHKRYKRKHMRMLDIAQYFDPVFLVLCGLIFINAIFIGFTIKSWKPLETSYVVVSTKGVSSPMPGEKFNKALSLENQTFIPFVAVLEPGRKGIEVIPQKLSLLPKQNVEYTLSIQAPDKIGFYTEKILKRAYPDVLPDKLLDMMYLKNRFLPLVIIFSPGIMLSIGLYIWWVRRWQIGRRKVMEWLMPFRRILRNLV